MSYILVYLLAKTKTTSTKTGDRTSRLCCAIMPVKGPWAVFVWHLRSGVPESREEDHKPLTLLQVLTFL